MVVVEKKAYVTGGMTKARMAIRLSPPDYSVGGKG